jgi:hypothetical protein
MLQTADNINDSGWVKEQGFFSGSYATDLACIALPELRGNKG